MTAFTQIPVVSLEDWRTTDHPEQFARHLVEICHHVGFFTLVDHGVDREFLER